MKRMFMVFLLAAQAVFGFDRASMAGSWTLNQDKSDKPRNERARMADKVTIAVTGAEVTIDAGGKRSLTLYTDGRAQERETPNGRSVTTKAKWDGDRLVSTMSTSGRDVARTTYELADSGKRLIVSTEPLMKRRGRGQSMKRVYDRDPAML